MAKKGSVLICDDEEIMRDVLETILTHAGYKVELAKTGEEALELYSQKPFEVVLMDVSMPGMGGLTALEELLKVDPDAVIIMITAYATFDTAISAWEKGAHGVIRKPFQNDQILAFVSKGIRRRRAEEERQTLRQVMSKSVSRDAIVGRSEKMEEIFRLVERVAPARSTVLIQGESGTGKELVAKAIIFASGAITTGRSSDSALGGQMVGSDTIVQAVNDAANDTSIKAIVLRVDSPGGSALASDLMWYAIENAKAKKPVVVSMGDVAASGGYYISTNASKVVAEPTTITGSIGVFMGKPVVKGFYDWLGVSTEYTLRGKNAGIFRETDKWTPEERAKMEEQTNGIYFNNFLPKVAKGRNMDAEKANTLGQGRVWTGTQAKENGLIDEFGGLEKAIEIAKQLANLPADKDVRRVVLPAPKPFFQQWFGSGEDAEVTANIKEAQAKKALVEAMPAEMRKAFRYAELLDRMHNGEAMFLLPFELEIK